MPGLVPGIHVLLELAKDVDGRDEPGHDAQGGYCSAYINKSIRCGISGISAGGIG
jgi:hypothetical protein